MAQQLNRNIVSSLWMKRSSLPDRHTPRPKSGAFKVPGVRSGKFVMSPGATLTWRNKRYLPAPTDSAWRVYKRAPLVLRAVIASLIITQWTATRLSGCTLDDLYQSTQGRYYLKSDAIPGILWHDLRHIAMPSGSIWGPILQRASASRWWTRLIEAEGLRDTSLATGLTSLRKLTTECREYFLERYLGLDQ